MIRIESVWINPDAIVAVEVSSNMGFLGALIKCESESFHVHATPEEVAEMVLEYKIAMMDYKVLYAQGESVFHIEEKLQRLAGLGHLINT